MLGVRSRDHDVALAFEGRVLRSIALGDEND